MLMYGKNNRRFVTIAWKTSTHSINIYNALIGKEYVSFCRSDDIRRANSQRLYTFEMIYHEIKAYEKCLGFLKLNGLKLYPGSSSLKILQLSLGKEPIEADIFQ